MLFRNSIILVPAAILTASAGILIWEDRARADAEKNDKAGKTITFTVKDKGNELRLAKGEVLELKMEMRAGTGFSWSIARNNDDLLKLAGKPVVEPLDKPKPGAPQFQVFRFLGKSAGTSDLELHYKRPFEKDKEPAKVFKLAVRIE